jgi:type VI secretion system secreted protein VgrG
MGSSFTQANRPLQITTTLGADVLLLADISGREAMSDLFEFRVRMYSENSAIAPKDILTTSATASIQLRGTAPRYFNGIFRDFAQAGFDRKSGLYTYEGTLVPSFWLLTLYTDCRIFQNKSVPDIVSAVFSSRSISNYKNSLSGTYSPRDYCVQYRETDLNFVARLLEQEGISWYFTHENGKHTLVLTDQTKSAPESPQTPVSWLGSPPEGGIAGQTSIWSFDYRNSVLTAKSTLTDYNFETPSTNLLATTNTIVKRQNTSQEIYDYPGSYSAAGDGTNYVKVRMEELETGAETVEGSSDCETFAPGFQFTLADHFSESRNISYLLTSVVHSATQSAYVAGASDSFQYKNEFEAIPVTVAFRPPRLSRQPVISGLQPAVVVGPSGEEIYVDKYGRVKLQFFWDRLGKKDENSSCWVRVASIWAGKNWGWITHPRIGQEVLVDFLEGDPDRPVVVGRVYNAEQMPPYTLPDNMTQSVMKSRSSKGGGTDNFNEIHFEDKKGSEVFFMHAEKDMTTEVEHDDSQTVQNDRTIVVDGKHTETITKDTTITIKEGNHSLEVSKGNQSITVDTGNQTTKISTGNQSITVSMGDQSTKVELGSASHEAMQQIELKVGQSSIVLTQQGVTIKGMMISIEGTVQLEAKAVMTTVSADAIMTVKGALTMIN